MLIAVFGAGLALGTALWDLTAGALLGCLGITTSMIIPGRRWRAHAPDGFRDSYAVPICQTCLSQLRPRRRRMSAGSTRSGSNRYLRSEVGDKTIVLTFLNPEYAALFRKANAGREQIDDATLLVGPAPSLEGQLALLLDRLLPHSLDKRWHRSPHIPETTLKNAIGEYARDVAPDDVLGLFDATPVGSGKAGFLLTSQSLYFNGDLVDSDGTRRKATGSVAWTQIVKAIASADGKVQFVLGGRRSEFVTCCVANQFQRRFRKLVDQVVLYNLSSTR